MNKGSVYALWDYTSQQADELSFSEGDALTVLRRRDDTETEWWWARLNDREGYVPRNLLGVRKHTQQHGTHPCRHTHTQRSRNPKSRGQIMILEVNWQTEDAPHVDM